ncbi:MAG: hypothetical protein PHX51_02925 [Clostridia bacterium]|nr:hypothetical protein [Clostridia bacterium]
MKIRLKRRGLIIMAVVVIAVVGTLAVSGVFASSYGFYRTTRSKRIAEYQSLATGVTLWESLLVEFNQYYEDGTRVSNVYSSYVQKNALDFSYSHTQKQSDTVVIEKLWAVALTEYSYSSLSVDGAEPLTSTQSRQITAEQLNEMSEVAEMRSLFGYITGFMRHYVMELYYFDEGYTMYKAIIADSDARAFFKTASNMQLVMRFDGETVDSVELSFSLACELDDNGDPIQRSASAVTVLLSNNKNPIIANHT